MTDYIMNNGLCIVTFLYSRLVHAMSLWYDNYINGTHSQFAYSYAVLQEALHLIMSASSS